MATLNPPGRHFIYQKGKATLHVGTDVSGNIFSKIVKNGKTIAEDMYIRFPTEVQLYKQGWIRVDNHE